MNPRTAAAKAASSSREASDIQALMQKLLPETYGVMVYQEDVLKIAHEIAGMSFGEADLLRRAMSGKLRSRDAMTQVEQKFLSGAIGYGLSREEANELWRQISSFAGYSFCKGHSAAFAALSYQVAYLKAHHPAEFFAAVLTNQGGFYGPGAYLSEVRRWGIEVRLPCVNQSEVDFTGRSFKGGFAMPVTLPDGQAPGGQRQQAGGASEAGHSWLRIGLGFLRGVSQESARTIVEERGEGGAYSDLQDFMQRTGIGLEECRTLIKVGAGDCLGNGSIPPRLLRPQLLLAAECLARQRERFGGKDSLGLESPLQALLPPGKTLGARGLTLADICRYEIEVLGYMVSAHPLDFVSLPPAIVQASEMRQHVNRRVRMAGWMIAAKPLATKTDGKPMKMLSMEDKSATFEAVLFPRVYERYATRTLSCGPYLLEGKIDAALGSPTLNVERLEVLRRGR